MLWDILVTRTDCAWGLRENAQVFISVELLGWDTHKEVKFSGKNE